ncbi:MAG: LysM peptidoglycan-binding domain-containing protein [Anaerolineales bacterium]
MFIGLLAALISVLIIGGGLGLSLMEDSVPIALVPTESPFLLLPTRVNPTQTSTTGNVDIRSESPNTPTSTPTPTQLLTATPLIPSPTPSCSFPSGWSIIIIEPGDTLESIAQKYNITPQELAEGNCLVTETILPGSTLYVPGLPPTEVVESCGPPPGWVFYTVQENDSLFGLSLIFGVSVEDLQNANCMGDSITIRIGQKIFVPFVPTSTLRPTSTVTPKEKPIPSDTPTPTTQVSPTWTPSSTPFPSLTPTNTSSTIPSVTTQAPPTKTATNTLTSQPSRTSTPTITPTMTNSPTFTPTKTKQPSQTPTITPSSSFTPTDTIVVITITP